VPVAADSEMKMAVTKPTLYKSDADYPKVANPAPTPVLQTVVVEQVQTGAPSWKEKLGVWKDNTVVAIKHLNITKAQNWNDNVDWTKLKVKQSVPYLNAVCAVTGIGFNLNNWNIRK